MPWRCEQQKSLRSMRRREAFRLSFSAAFARAATMCLFSAAPKVRERIEQFVVAGEGLTAGSAAA